MNRVVIGISALLVAGLGERESRADGPRVEAASRAWAITDAVLGRQLDPPARQAMILAGVKAMAEVAKVEVPAGLSLRVSNLSGPEPLAVLLEEVMAGPKLEGGLKPTLKAPSPFEGRTPEEAFFEGMLASVPGGATLMSEKERKVQESMAANLYVGIQVALSLDDKSKRPFFHEILEGGPAEKAGAKAGDVIEEVDGESTEGMRLAKVVDRLRGLEGTEVVVRLRRPENGEVTTRTMTRGRLPRASIRGVRPLPAKRWDARLQGAEPIGYLKIDEITGSTPRELRAFAEQLESEGLQALVLDLQGIQTAGFHATVLLADALLDGGVIGRVRFVDGEKTYRAQPDALFRGWPMVVLAAKASSPEVAWLVDALRDHRRATILGEPSLTQEPVVLEDVPLPGGEWSVRMATGRLERGDGSPLADFHPETGQPDARQVFRGGTPAVPYAAQAPAYSILLNPLTRPSPVEANPIGQAREILAKALEAAR